MVKHKAFDVDTPIDTVLNDVQELEYIATSDLNTYTNQQYINLAYNIINKKGRYKINLQEWNQKYTPGKTLAAFKPHFGTAH